MVSQDGDGPSQRPTTTPGPLSPARSSLPRDAQALDEIVTDTRLDSESWQPLHEEKVPGLTVLWHTDPARVGDRRALFELADGGVVELGRLAPLFGRPEEPLAETSGSMGGRGAAAGPRQPAPLGDPRISRTPLRLYALGVDGGGSRGGHHYGDDHHGDDHHGDDHHGGDHHGGDRRLRLERAGSRTPVEIDGQPLDQERTFESVELDAGVVLVLGHRVTLLLHRLDPVLPPRLPRYGMVGDSPEMVRLRQGIRRVADLDTTVLVRGETGTGKELIAQALHRASPRRSGPFVAVDMASVPTTLAAAELFGAERGAYTGADRRRAGYFRQAAGGTLFLDEIGEAPQELQTMLLRTLETRRIRPVGADADVATDVRLVSATDLDLERAVSGERFSAPLLHRLGGFVLRAPPLRARREDFGRLLRFFLARELAAIGEEDRLVASDAGRAGGPGPDRPWLPATLVARLAAHPWPGNVRQLANVARQLVIAHRGEARVRSLEAVRDLLGPEGPTVIHPTGSEPAAGPGAARPRRPADIREPELLEALRRNRFRPRDTARELGIARGSLYELMARCPRVRKASELGRAEIEAALEAEGGSSEAAAEALEVSTQALRRQMGKLGLEP